MRLSLLATALLSGLILTACGSLPKQEHYMDNDGFTLKIAGPGDERNPDIQRVVWQSQFENVLLVKRELGSALNQHPQALPAHLLRAQLEAVKVNTSGDVEPLFSAEELERLVPTLALALSAATPDQDVLVHLTQEKSALLVMREKMMLTLRVFASEGRLHLMVGTIRGGFEGMFQRAGVLKHFDVPVRAAARMNLGKLVADGAVTYAQAGRTDWVSWPIQPIVAVVPAAQQITPASSVNTTPTLDVQQRLQVLQGLKDKGLLTDSEYQEQRRRILDSL
jgi:hypothetical protein